MTLVRLRHLAKFAFCTAFLSHQSVLGGQPPTLEWIKQFVGVPGYHETMGAVSFDPIGNIYVSESRWANAGVDVYLHKYEADGSNIWTRQLGAVGDVDGILDISVAANFTTVVGHATGDVGGPNAGGPATSLRDAFIRTYTSQGEVSWTRKLGTKGDDSFWGVATDDAGNLFVGGTVGLESGGVYAGHRDAVLTKYDSAGSVVWLRTLSGSENDEVYGVASDPLGNIFISGGTNSSLASPNLGKEDAFLAKYDNGGNLIWSRQYGGAGWDAAREITVDSAGNLYAVEAIATSATAFQDSYHLTKYDANGTSLWSRQLGANNNASVNDVVTDISGNVYVAGGTLQSLGQPNAGREDAFVRKYDSSGNQLWTWQIGSMGADSVLGLAIDNQGRIVVAGTVDDGSLAAPNPLHRDAWLAVLREVPEPGGASLALLGLGGVLSRRRRQP